jgi:exosome complex component CSL4
MKKNIVFPGDPLVSAEELLPGEGTYGNGEWIRAAIFGELQIDRKEKNAYIKPLTAFPAKIKKGDKVIAKVKEVGAEMAFFKIACKADNPLRSIPNETEAILHISQVSREYTIDIGKEYHPNDIIRAQVISNPPGIKLSTKGKEFGAIKAYCTRCKNPLIRKNNLLYCEECKRSEMRKIAFDYGEGKISF